MSLESVKNDKACEIHRESEAEKLGVLSFDIGGNTCTMQGGRSKLDRIGDARLYIENDGRTSGSWVNVDRSIVTLTLDEFTEFYNAVNKKGGDVFNKKVGIMLQIDACTTEEQVNSITW